VVSLSQERDRERRGRFVWGRVGIATDCSLSLPALAELSTTADASATVAVSAAESMPPGRTARGCQHAGPSTTWGCGEAPPHPPLGEALAAVVAVTATWPERCTDPTSDHAE
jgi:hypothetical protein